MDDEDDMSCEIDATLKSIKQSLHLLAASCQFNKFRMLNAFIQL